MRICAICYAEIEEDEEGICDNCKNRKPAKVLKEGHISDEEVIERFKELMAKRKEKIELLADKLRRKSVKYEMI